jgi:prepilin-type N-terminal cleavage/methylation domain-containing protein
MKSSKNKKGFTLIEMLVVVLIIGILAAIALPQYQKAIEKSRFAEAFTLIGTLGRAQELYKLTTGNVSFTFGNFDINMPNATPTSGAVGGNLQYISGGGLRGKNFDYVIVSHSSDFWYGSIAIIRTSGKFKNAGFVYSKGQVYCAEHPSVDFCMMYNTMFYQTVSGWYLYRIL